MLLEIITGHHSMVARKCQRKNKLQHNNFFYDTTLFPTTQLLQLHNLIYFSRNIFYYFSMLCLCNLTQLHLFMMALLHPCWKVNGYPLRHTKSYRFV